MKLVARGLLITVGLLLVLVAVLAVFRVPILPGLELISQGAFGDKFGWSRTLVKMTPLLLCGLGAVVAWRAGMYNVGGEGQFLIGGLAGAALAMQVPPGPFALGLILLASILGGGAWAWLAGWLYLRRGVEVVISTILLNFVAIQLLGWLVAGPLQDRTGGVPLTPRLDDATRLWRPDRQMDLHLGVLLAVVVALTVSVFLWRTRSGFRLRLVGENPRAARANRIDAPGQQLAALLLSGALCGLAGGIEYTGMAGQIGASFSQNWGFLGIPVALLAELNPIAAIPSAFFFGALFAGSENLSRFTPSGTTMVYVIQAGAVLAYLGILAWNRHRQNLAATAVEAA